MVKRRQEGVKTLQR